MKGAPKSTAIEGLRDFVEGTLRKPRADRERRLGYLRGRVADLSKTPVPEALKGVSVDDMNGFIARLEQSLEQDT